MQFKKCIFIITVFLAITEYGYCSKGLTETAEKIDFNKGPWFTGPLLTPSGYVVPLGHANIEPYFYVTDIYAQYNANWKSKSIPNIWGESGQLLMQVGVASFMDVVLIPQFTRTETQSRSSSGFNDFPLGVDIQLLPSKPGNPRPAIKLTLIETFPTGKYKNLNPNKRGADARGLGAYTTGIGLIASQLFRIHKSYYLSMRFGMNYTLATKVHVTGFNTYGGGFGTKGTVYPGNVWNTFLGLEFSLTRNWVLAMDVLNVYKNKTRFTGVRGVTSNSQPDIIITDENVANIGLHSSNQISLAPAIEYNFSQSLGIIAGCWFTIAGRNAPNFISGVVALNWYVTLGTVNQ